jgi:hypothetical protein
MGVTGDNAYLCPRSGQYTLKTWFKVPQISDYYFHYTPDIKLSFYDGASQRLLACAGTGTHALHKKADAKAKHGLLALGISVLVFLIVFGLCCI